MFRLPGFQVRFTLRAELKKTSAQSRRRHSQQQLLKNLWTCSRMLRQPYEHDNGGLVDKDIKKVEDHTKQLNLSTRWIMTTLIRPPLEAILAVTLFRPERR